MCGGVATMMRAAALAAFVAGASAHGGLTIPPPRNNHGNRDPRNWTSDGTPGGNYHSGGPCAGGECLWFSEGCYHGCDNCSLTMPTTGNYYGAPNCARPLEPTLPDEFATWNIPDSAGKRPSKFGDWTKYHPWRAPGRAPTADPCGVAGGYLTAQGGGGQTPEGATHQGQKGSTLPPLEGVRTEWKAGGVEEVGFMLGANHGGGYLYSVCPKSEPLTERCLQANSLEFVGSNHTIRYLDGRPDIEIPARDVSVGTFPPLSAWRLNPVPACNCDKGFACQAKGQANCTAKTEACSRQPYAIEPAPEPHGFDCPTGTQFPVPFPYGYGQQVWNLTPKRAGVAADTWVIVDHVKAPTKPGEYILRWRWDVEQNPQIWTHCADLTVV